MTGSGTQASPYIVTDWNELAQVFPTAQYIELGNDIQAPDLTTNITAGYLVSFDGKGHSIAGLYNASGYALTFNKSSGGYFNLSIKNINFYNINCQGDGFIHINGTNDGGYINLQNAVFSGDLLCNNMLDIMTRHSVSATGVGGYIHTNAPAFKIAATGSNAHLAHGKFTLNYGNIEPLLTNSVIGSALADNVEFIIRAPENGKIYFAKCQYCSFIGNGNIKITSNSGVNVIADTLNLDENSTGDNHILTIADMKNVQVLYDLGFPVSGVVS